METQKQFVISNLNEFGEISRNTCLKQYITRLGAIIYSLKKQGWKIESDYRQTEYGKDFVYKLVSKPQFNDGRRQEFIDRELERNLQPRLI